MKRAFCLALLLACLALLGQASELSHVFDLANVLTPMEEARLQQQAEELYLRTGFDVMVHTTSNSMGKGPENYTRDYYLANRDVDRYPDGAMLAIMFDTRDYHEATRGKGFNYLTLRENHNLAGVIQSKLSDGDYYGAFSDYISYVSRMMDLPPVSQNQLPDNVPDGNYTDYTDYYNRVINPTTPMERAVEWLPYMLGGGLLIGLVYALSLKSKLKIAKFKRGADQYVIPNSLNLTDSRDIYLYQTVTRTKIQTTSSGSGGSRSGGGFSTGSRGGSSFGGRGGKF